MPLIGANKNKPIGKLRQAAVDPIETAAVEPVPVAAPSADPYGYIQPPTDTSGFGGFMNQLKYINQVNPGAFTQLGAGIMANDVAGGISHAGQEMQQGQQLQQRAREKLFSYQEEQRNKGLTRQWLRGQFPNASEADLDAMSSNPDILNHMFKQAEGSGSEVFGNPIYGTDPETGETVVGTYDKQGKFHKIETPGFDVSSGVKTIETATEVITINSRDGTVIAREPKNVAEGERLKKIGIGQGEAQTLLTSLETKLPGLQTVMTELEILADKATYTKGGKLWDTIRKETGQEPREAAVARSDYISKIDTVVLPMLKDTFGGAFTYAEGQELKRSLGDPDLSPAEKKAVIKNFINQKKRDIAAVAGQTGQGGGGSLKEKYGFD